MFYAGFCVLCSFDASDALFWLTFRSEPPLGSKLCVKCAFVKIVIFLQENLTLAGTGGLGPLPKKGPGGQ